MTSVTIKSTGASGKYRTYARGENTQKSSYSNVQRLIKDKQNNERSSSVSPEPPSNAVASASGGGYLYSQPQTPTTNVERNYTQKPEYSSPIGGVSGIMAQNIATKKYDPQGSVKAQFVEKSTNTPVTGTFPTQSKTYEFTVQTEDKNTTSLKNYKEVKSGFTPGGTVGAYEKPSFASRVGSRAKAEFVGFAKGFTGDKETYGGLKDFSGSPQSGQFGAVLSLPASAGFEAVGYGLVGAGKQTYLATKTAYGSTKTAYASTMAKTGAFIESTKVGKVAFGVRETVLKTPYVGYGVEFVEGVGVAVGSSYAISQAGYRLSGTDTQTFKTGYSQATESARPQGFIKGVAYDISGGTFLGDKEKFKRTSFNYFISQGYSIDQATKLTSYAVRQKQVGGFSEGVIAVGVGGLTEGLGRKGVSKNIKSLSSFNLPSSEAFSYGAKKSFVPIAKAGFIEGVAVGTSTDILRGQNIDYKKAGYYGLAGAGTAGVLGSIDVGLTTKSAIKGTKGSKFLAKTYDVGLNVIDPTEKPGDIYRDFTETSVTRYTKRSYESPQVRTGNFAGVKVFSFTTSGGTTPTSTKTQRRSSFINTFSPTPTNTKTQSRTGVFTPTNVFTPTPTNTRTTTKTNIGVYTPSTVFTPAMVNTPTTVNTPVDIPTPVITNKNVAGLPLFGVSGGRGGGVGKRGGQSFRYAPSVGAVLFNIRGKKAPSRLSGFEVRPIVSSSRKKRRR